MKRIGKILSLLLCAALLVGGTAVAASVVTTRTLEAQFMNIQLEVDGKPVAPKDANGNAVEPFMVDGTVYLPVRALVEALGREVAWNAETNTVSVLSPFLQDARYLVETIESTHPCFVLDDVPEGYAAAKETFLAAAAQPDLNTVQFAWSAMAYTSSLKDGHTQMLGMIGGMPEMKIQWAASGEHLYLLDENNKITGREVTKIGGAPVKDVFAVVDTYFAAENAAYSDRNHSQLTKLNSVLQMAGADVTGGKTTVTTVESGRETVTTVEIAAPTGGGAQPVVIDHKMMGDVFYIDFNACKPGPEVDATAAALSEAVKAGTSKVIIDVRGNGGGDSSTCEQLLAAMDMAAPAYGGYIRLSPLAKQTYPEFADKSQDVSGAPDLSAAKQNPKVTLVVLTDEYTFSSATMLGVFVQDGNLGTLVGRPSANSPSCYGDVLSYTLPNTQFQGGVSYKQFQRPNAAADQKILMPDIETALGEDILQTALDSFLN